MRIKRLFALAALAVLGLNSPLRAAEPVGAAFCVTCHDSEDMTDNSRSAHGFVADKRAPDCISCHGTSEGHAHQPANVSTQPKPEVTFGKKFGKVSTVAADDRNRSCQSCHDKDHKRALWSGSAHQNAGVTCDTCHQVHANKDKILDRKQQAETCFQCHKEQRTQINKPSHHPVPEGKMTCSDCHNVHGSSGPKLVLRDSINDTCYTCHAEKRGPFVQQHDPVAEDCSTCHNSHGSTIPGMLKTRAPMLCQQCHTPHLTGNVGALGGQGGVFAPATGLVQQQVTNLSNGKNVVNLWQGRSCLNCHTQVHGSNSPSSTNPLMR